MQDDVLSHFCMVVKGKKKVYFNPSSTSSPDLTHNPLDHKYVTMVAYIRTILLQLAYSIPNLVYGEVDADEKDKHGSGKNDRSVAQCSCNV